MIVDADRLAVLPVADRLLRAAAGDAVSEVTVGPLGWSNELALHVIEFKTDGPVPTLKGAAAAFAAAVEAANRLLTPLDGRLMPSAMHPWMDPGRETRLWPYDNGPIYAAYNRIFGCSGHGWANLQSAHLNLPFHGDDEFARLHAAIRLLLPILPALAASSPFREGRSTGLLDTRLDTYRGNQRRIPSLTGEVIPEPVYSRAAYRREILQRLYRDIAPFDPERVLRHEWLNSRGAIARFERDTIEIRVLDVQECPAADLAVLAAAVAVLKALVSERWQPLALQERWPVAPLAAILQDTIRFGGEAVIGDADYLAAFGFGRGQGRAGDLWRHLVEALLPGGAADEPAVARTLAVILGEGTLARRLLLAAGEEPSPATLHEIYHTLCVCLEKGESFHA
jgi:hypothetical protein